MGYSCFNSPMCGYVATCPDCDGCDDCCACEYACPDCHQLRAECYCEAEEDMGNADPDDPREYEAEADPKKYDQGGEG